MEGQKKRTPNISIPVATVYSQDTKSLISISMWAAKFVFNFNSVQQNTSNQSSPGGERANNSIILDSDQLAIVAKTLELIIAERSKKHEQACNESNVGNNFFDITPNYNPVERIEFDNSFVDNSGNIRNNGNLSISSKEIEGTHRVVISYNGGGVVIDVILMPSRSKQMVAKLLNKKSPGFDANDSPLYAFHMLLSRSISIPALIQYNCTSALYRLLSNNKLNYSDTSKKYTNTDTKSNDIF